MKNIESGVYSNKDLSRVLGSNVAVQRALASNFIEKVGRGYYSTPDIPELKRIPLIVEQYYSDTVVSKATLLYHYKLTFDQPELFDLDAKNESSYREGTDIFNICRTRKMKFVTTSNFNGVKLKCYAVERAVFEVLEIERGIGDMAIEVVQSYVRNYQPDFSSLAEVAGLFGKRGEELLKLIQAIGSSRVKANVL